MSRGDELAAYTAAAAGSAWGPGRRAGRVVRAAAVAAAACLIGAGAFLAGEHHHQQQGMTVLTGVATVGADEASVTVAGWTYGLQGPGNLTWVDRQGMTHVGGWPACLADPGTTARIRFGEVPVALPGGGMVRQIVWVDCQA
jgi:hypothetical protein